MKKKRVLVRFTGGLIGSFIRFAGVVPLDERWLQEETGKAYRLSNASGSVAAIFGLIYGRWYAKTDVEIVEVLP